MSFFLRTLWEGWNLRNPKEVINPKKQDWIFDYDSGLSSRFGTPKMFNLVISVVKPWWYAVWLPACPNLDIFDQICENFLNIILLWPIWSILPQKWSTNSARNLRLNQFNHIMWNSRSLTILSHRIFNRVFRKTNFENNVLVSTKF